MALSLTTRPKLTTPYTSNWNAGKLPVVYKFTSTSYTSETNYRIEFEIFKSSDNTSLTGGVKFTITPNSSGISYADIGSIVAAYLTHEWENIATDNEEDADISLKVYIKYQELYDGSGASVQNDSANPVHVVLASLSIPSTYGGNLLQYVPYDENSKWLTKFERLSMWRDYPFTLSFIWPAEQLAILRRIVELDYEGNTLFDDSDVLTENIGAVNRVLVTGIDPDTKTVQVTLHEPGPLVLTGFLNTGAGSVSWTADTDGKPKLAGSGSFSSKIVYIPFPATAAGIFNIEYNYTTNASHSVNIYLLDAGLNVIPTAIYSGVGGIGTIIGSQNLDSDVDVPVYLGFALSYSGGGSRSAKINELSSDDVIGGPGDAITETMTIDVKDACQNPVYLFWKNSLGGDSFWMFEHGQEAEYKYDGVRKFKAKKLFAENVTLSEWEALNELHTTGEVYKENIIELTSSINKTSKRDDQQAYVIDEDGNKTGVIVTRESNKIRTRNSLHGFETEIEFPEVFL